VMLIEFVNGLNITILPHWARMSAVKQVITAIKKRLRGRFFIDVNSLTLGLLNLSLFSL